MKKITLAKASLPYSASVEVWAFCITSPPAAITLCVRAVFNSCALIENKFAVSFKAVLFSMKSLSSISLKVILPYKSNLILETKLLEATFFLLIFLITTYQV